MSAQPVIGFKSSTMLHFYQSAIFKSIMILISAEVPDMNDIVTAAPKVMQTRIPTYLYLRIATIIMAATSFPRAWLYMTPPCVPCRAGQGFLLSVWSLCTTIW